MIKSGYESMNEKAEVNPFKGLKKVDDPAPGKTLPEGYVTDGLGNVYKLPNSGFSKVIEYRGYHFRYNYHKRRLEMLESAKSGVMDAQNLSPNNWFESSEYFMDKYIDEFESLTKV